MPWSARTQRLKVHAKARDIADVDRVVIRDGEAIAAVWPDSGPPAVLAWEERRMRRRGPGHRQPVG